MRIRFGFVAMSLQLAESSPSKTITATNFIKYQDDEVKLSRLIKIAKGNLANSLRILRHAVANGIYVYRFTSKLIPLATHPLAEFWDWQCDLSQELKELGDYIKQHQVRVSAHPDHFTLINSPNEEVIHASIKDLQYHHNIFQAMKLGKEAKLVIHLGGGYKDKPASINRFIKNYSQLSCHLKERLTLENDDKTYNIQHILTVCEQLTIPMVLDLHHHQCNPGDTDLSQLLARIFATWQKTGLVPKIHLSSPKSSKQFRSHADNINPDCFIQFLQIAKVLDQDFDVMLEAKNKDLALFNLMKILAKDSRFTFETDAIVRY